MTEVASAEGPTDGIVVSNDEIGYIAVRTTAVGPGDPDANVPIALRLTNGGAEHETELYPDEAVKVATALLNAALQAENKPLEKTPSPRA
ncbi:hypothetical protein [Qaidamihabitans albus]|uniref:hypothetical protein n=1 Tax=Qaidamihabitans albus TaxID=2795733 RepID=UPI0018F25CB8|nr:hypothetical protein [Qaidamihabitans albus]